MRLERGLVLSGGQAPKKRGLQGYGVAAVTFLHNGLAREFVPVLVNDFWMLKVVGGLDALKGSLKDSEIVDTIKNKLLSLDASSHAPAAGEAAGEGEADPMSSLDRTDGAGGPKAKPKPAQKRAKRHRSAWNEPQRIGVPLRPQDPPDGHHITAMLSGNPKGGQKLFIAADDLPWLCEYMLGELHGAGVPEPRDPDAEGEDAAAAASDGVAMRWCPSGMWRACPTRGPLQGREFQSRLNEMTKQKYDAGAALLPTEKPFHAADHSTKRQVLMLWLRQQVTQKMVASECLAPAAADAADDTADTQATSASGSG